MERKFIAAVVCFVVPVVAACTHFAWKPAEQPASEHALSAPVPPEPASAAEAPPAPRPRLRRGALLIGASVADAHGAHAGTLADFLIDRETGEVVCVVVLLEPSEGRREVKVVHTRSVVWEARALDAPALVLSCSRAELSKHDELYTDLFDGSVATDVKGEITDIDTLPAATSNALLLKVRDGENLLHRVLIEPADLVERHLPLLELGRAVQVEGVLTRDGTGKLLIVNAVTQEGERVVLRNAAGEIEWEELGQCVQSARELPESELLLPGGPRLPITGWVLDCTRGVAPYLCVEVAGVERALPWSEVEYAEEAGGWRADAGAAGRLSALPVVTTDGQVRDPP